MKSKLALQALAVGCSVTLLGAYVVYAHRKAQQASDLPVSASTSTLPSATEGPATESSPSPAESAGVNLAPASDADPNAIQPSRINGPIFRDSSLPPNPAETASSAAAELPSSSPAVLNGNDKVQFRLDGSSVVTRVRDAGPQATIAPSSKVLINVFASNTKKTEAPPANGSISVNGQNIRIGSFRNSESPKLVTVLPHPATPAEPAPKVASQTLPLPISTATAPIRRETIIFSTKSAPVFVAPRTAPAEAPAPAPATPAPTAPTAAIAGTLAPTAPAAIPPPHPTQPAAANVRAPQPDAPPAQQLQRQLNQTTQTAQKPRFLAPGSKSIDLLLLESAKTPQPTQKVVPAAPRQIPTQPKAP